VGFFSLPPRPDQLRGSPTLLPNEYQGNLSLRVKLPGNETDCSPSSRVKVFMRHRETLLLLFISLVVEPLC